METNELKPCPFCGNIPTIKICGDILIIECSHHDWSKPDECGIRIAGDIDICADIIGGKFNFSTNEYEYSREEIERCKNAAIKAWNIRSDRTCKAERDYDAMEDGVPDCRIWRCSCGEAFPFWRGCNPEYCPECGSKVVK